MRWRYRDDTNTNLGRGGGNGRKTWTLASMSCALTMCCCWCRVWVQSSRSVRLQLYKCIMCKDVNRFAWDFLCTQRKGPGHSGESYYNSQYTGINLKVWNQMQSFIKSHIQFTCHQKRSEYNSRYWTVFQSDENCLPDHTPHKDWWCPGYIFLSLSQSVIKLAVDKKNHLSWKMFF